MNNLKKELLSINYLTNTLVRLPSVYPNFLTNDKEPSWDGDIKVYATLEQTNSKSKLRGRIPTQIKGTSTVPLHKESIKYRVDVADLRNYLNDRGCLYFVVAITDDLDSEDHSIYYKSLTPVRIQKILNNTDNCDSVSVDFDAFPKDRKKQFSVLNWCLSNFKLQGNISNQKLHHIYDLVDSNGKIEIQIPFIPHPYVTNEDMFWSKEVHGYIRIPGSDILEPLADDIIFIKGNETYLVKKPITIDGYEYYDEFYIEIVDNDISQIRVGNSFFFNRIPETDSFQVNFKTSDKMKTVLKDEVFALEVFEKGYFELDGEKLNFDNLNDELSSSDFNIQKESERIQYVRKIQQLMDEFGYSGDLDFSKFSVQDNHNVSLLIESVIEGKPVPIKVEPNNLTIIAVSELRFLVLIEESTYPDLRYLRNFLSGNFEIAIQIGDNLYHSISPFSVLHNFNVFDVNNYNVEEAVESFKGIEPNIENYSEANIFSLGLISCYDTGKDRYSNYLDVAKNLLLWLRNEQNSGIDKEIINLNLLQIKKRKSHLTEDELEYLQSLVEREEVGEDLKIAAYILMENYIAVKMHLKKLSPGEKEYFLQFPITHLIPKDINII